VADRRHAEPSQGPQGSGNDPTPVPTVASLGGPAEMSTPRSRVPRSPVTENRAVKAYSLDLCFRIKFN